MKRILERFGGAALVLWILLGTTFLIPATREMHILGARLLLQLRWNTYVQGQPPGCTIQVIPNVQFTEPFEQTLRRNSSRSPDDYVLAAATSGSYGAKLPPADRWEGHPLLEWGALRLAWLSRFHDSANDPNPTFPHLTSEIIRLAQKTHPENGALWLAQACHEFKARRDEAALEALEVAARKGIWRGDHKASFDYIARLLHRAGLSRLDATVQANTLASDTSALQIMLSIRRALVEKMTTALKVGDDAGFRVESRRWQDLQVPEWSDPYLANRFRSFTSGDDILNAIAIRTGGRTIPEWERDGKSWQDHYHEREKVIAEIRDESLPNYLKQHVGAEAAESILAQNAAVRAEIDRQRSQFRNARQNPAIRYYMLSSVAGMMSQLGFCLIAVTLLFRLPFRVVSSSAPMNTTLRNPKFWLLAVVAVAAGSALFAADFVSLGPEHIGFGPERPKPWIDPLLKNWLAALIICSAWFSAKMVFHCSNAPKVQQWLRHGLLAASYFYLLAIGWAAYFRAQTVSSIGFDMI